MIVRIPGHLYSTQPYDAQTGVCDVTLVFMHRVGPMYPGNTGRAFGGTNIQEVLRILIDRTKYLNGQHRHWINPVCVFLYRVALNLLEYRAAHRHGKNYRFRFNIEHCPTDPTNGHIL